MTSPVRHFLDLTQFGAEEIRGILAASVDMKRARKRGERQTVRPLEGKTLAMIFDKPSTRTRVSFDVAMRELGGETIMLTGAEMQLGRGETIGDTARVLSRYVDAIVISMLDQNAVRELAEDATVPVINGLTKASHPCQIMADVMTFEEHRGSIKGARLPGWETATMCSPPGSMRRRGSISASISPLPSNLRRRPTSSRGLGARAPRFGNDGSL